MENGEDSDICHKNLSKNLKKKTLIYFHCSFLLDFPEEHLPGFSQRILNIETLSKNSMFSFSFFILRRPKSVIPFVGGNNVIIISQSQMSCGIGQRKKTWKTHHHNKFRRKKNGNKNSYKHSMMIVILIEAFICVRYIICHQTNCNIARMCSMLVYPTVIKWWLFFFLKIVGNSRGCVKFVKGEWCWAMR